MTESRGIRQRPFLCGCVFTALSRPSASQRRTVRMSTRSTLDTSLAVASEGRVETADVMYLMDAMLHQDVGTRTHARTIRACDEACFLGSARAVMALGGHYLAPDWKRTNNVPLLRRSPQVRSCGSS